MINVVFNVEEGIGKMDNIDEIIREDVINVASAGFIPWEKLQDATVLVTGATGLIGTSFINTLNYVNEIKKLNLKVNY